LKIFTIYLTLENIGEQRASSLALNQILSAFREDFSTVIHDYQE
jgi:hypothetical protein